MQPSRDMLYVFTWHCEQSLPTTLALQLHCPVTLSQSPFIEPTAWQLQPKKNSLHFYDIMMEEIGRNLTQSYNWRMP